VDVKRLTRTAAVFAALLAVAQPTATARAQVCVGQPPIAALDQYCNTLPTPDGRPQPVARRPGRSTPPLSDTLPLQEVATLRDAGGPASALLLLPTAAPIGRGAAGAERRRRALRAAQSVIASGELDAPMGQPRTAVAKLATASPDLLGGAFRWGLVASTLGLAAIAWLRFRERLKL
jgi:hypothetical protein